MSDSGFIAADVSPRPKSLTRLMSLFHITFTARAWNAASAIFLFTARVIAVVAQLKFVERYFGGSFSGLTVVGNQVLLYITLLELGLAQAATSFLYEPILHGDHERTSALLIALRSDVRRMILFGSLAVFPVLALYARFLHSPVAYRTTVSTLFLVAVSAFIQLAAVHFQAYLNAAERLGWVNLVLGAGYLFKTAIGLVLAATFHQYLCLPAAISILTVVEFLCLKFAFKRQFSEFRPTEWSWAAKTIRNRARFALIHKAAGVAYYQSDFIILSLTAGLIAVKDYAKYQYISAALLSILGTISIALTSSFAYIQMNKPPEVRFRQYARIQFSAALLGAIACLGYFYVTPDVVLCAFGQAEPIRAWQLVLFGVALFLNIVKIADDMMLTARGAFRPGYGIPIFEVPIYISLGVILTRRFGFPGILVASAATNLLISVFVKGMLLSREVFDASRTQWFLRRAWNVAAAALLVSPLVALHWAVDDVFSSEINRAALWCGIAVLYGFLILRAFTLRSAHERIAIPLAESQP